MSPTMQEPTFLVLASLASGPKHGYALIQEADELTAGRVTLRVGTLYAALDRLAKQGLVERAGDDVVDGRLRRSYALTALGHSALEDEVERLQSMSARVAMKLTPRTTRWAIS